MHKDSVRKRIMSISLGILSVCVFGECSMIICVFRISFVQCVCCRAYVVCVSVFSGAVYVSFAV